MRTSNKPSPNRYEFLYELKGHLMLISINADLAPSFEKSEKNRYHYSGYFDGFSIDRLINSILTVAYTIEL